MDYTYLFKFIIVGDMAVGKSCLMLQFVEGKFKSNHDLTIGVEFGTKTVNLKDKFIKLQIWDTAGQENFRSLTRAYYRAAVGAVVAYDITRKESFNGLSQWIEDLRSNAAPHVVIMILGNKSDESSKRKVTYEEGKKFAEENNLLFFETCAKDQKSVEDAFMEMTKHIYDKIQNGSIDVTHENSGVKLGSDNTDYQSEVEENVPKKQGKNIKKGDCAC